MRLFLPSRAALDIPRSSFAPEPSDVVNAVELAAGVPVTQPIPEDANFIIFSSTTDIFVRFGEDDVSAAVPGTIADGSAPELNPGARAIPSDATHVALIAPAAGVATLSFYG
jgi:hypothetical protein